MYDSVVRAEISEMQEVTSKYQDLIEEFSVCADLKSLSESIHDND